MAHEGVLTWVSPSITEALGCSPADWIGIRLSDRVHAEDLPVFAAAVTDLASSQAVSCRFRPLGLDGVHHWVDVQVRPFIDAAGRNTTIAALPAWPAGQRGLPRGESGTITDVLSVPASVVEAWGLDGAVEPLDGGQSTSFRAGDLVLKPQPDEALVTWHAQLCDRVTASGFRLPAPVRSGDGRLVVDGWYATTFVTGHPVPAADGTVASWQAVLACSRAFHAAAVDEVRPVFLDARTDIWWTADRAAWNEGDPDEIGQQSRGLLRGLRELVLDEGLSPQVVHGDLSGNVLFAAGLPPAVIDLSPYWRPAAYADAIVVADALLWWHADPALAEVARPATMPPGQWRSLLARALVFRLIAFDEPRRDAAEVDDQIPRYASALGLLRTAFPSGPRLRSRRAR